MVSLMDDMKFALVPPVPVSGTSSIWNIDFNFVLGVSVGCGIHLFSSVGLCVFIFLNTMTSHFKGVGALTPIEIESHLELGREFLARGQYSDALSHYHAAVEGDPHNYLTFFKRAAVYLALGKSKPAVEDLNKVVDLKPDFLAARMQRGNVFLKQGRLDEAHIDFEWVLRFDPMNEEAVRHYGVIEPLKEDMRAALIMLSDRNYIGAVDVLTRLLQECPWNVELRERRAECFEAIGDIPAAIGDLRPTMKMKSDNTNGFLRLSELYYKLGDADESLIAIRECLKLDPDHKSCFSHYKKVKKLAAALKGMQDAAGSGDYDECVAKAKLALKVESESQRLAQYANARMCHCMSKGSNTLDAIQVCTDAMTFGEDVNILCDRAEAHIANENFDDALQDYQKAANMDEHSQRAQEGHRRAQKLLKQSKKRDYYKILGVKRNAVKKDILRAYRKHASKWHPDNFQGEEKKTAEKKFIDIAAAKEVLTDPEKRQQFDNGEDPLDPESQAGQNFNPFGQGFNPFGGGGGPFTFKFHFN